MKKYEYKATNLIAEAFEKYDVRYHTVYKYNIEQLMVSFNIACGPSTDIRFISKSDDNSVEVRILGLINETPKDRRFRMLQACNILNMRTRHLRFHVDNNGNINMEYDFPTNYSNDSLGEMAMETIYRTLVILNEEYGIFMKALYTDEDLEEFEYDEHHKVFQLLKKHLEERIASSDEEDDEE